MVGEKDDCRTPYSAALHLSYMLILKVNGTDFQNWTSARVSRGLAQAAADFELEVTDKWKGQKISIRPFDECRLTYDGAELLTGYVEQISINYSATEHSIRINGRSKTCDIVDCAAETRQFNNQTLKQIAEALCQPFGISVLFEADGGAAFQTYKPDDGVTVFEALEKLARLRGLLMTDNGSGNLVFTQAGKKHSGATLKLGVNIESADATQDVRDIFSDYRVKGQQRGGDDIDPEFAAHVQSSTKDSRTPRYRPMQVNAEDQADTKAAQTRVEWERNIRFAKSQSMKYQTTGWKNGKGLWQINTIVDVDDDMTGFKGQRLIAGIDYTLTETDGTQVALDLVHPDAFLPEPVSASESKQPAKGGMQW